MILIELRTYFRVNFNKEFVNFPGGFIRDDYKIAHGSKPLFSIFYNKIKRE